MKKFLLFIGVILALTAVFILLRETVPVIGTAWGPGCHRLTVDGRDYVLATDPPVHGGQSDSLLGVLKSGKDRIWVWGFRETDEYLYCRWQWEGWVYRRVEP